METVFLLIAGGKITPEFTMLRSSTISEVKEMIKTLTNVDVSRQTLKFGNKELMNDKSLADYDIRFSADLVLEVTPLPGEPEFNILVKFCSQEATMRVKETTLVAELRNKIVRLWGIPTKNTTLHFRSTAMEDDDATVLDYYICEGCQVEVKVIEP